MIKIYKFKTTEEGKIAKLEEQAKLDHTYKRDGSSNIGVGVTPSLISFFH